MTEHLQPKQLFSYLFILGIAILFALQWGPGSRGCDQSVPDLGTQYAAKVNGRDIPIAEFRLAYRNQIARQQIPESIARQFGMPKQVLDQMVQLELLAQQAEKQHLLPSDQELRRIIHRNPDFQKDGKFDLTRYRQVLREYYQRTDADFEAELRRQVAANKLLELIEGSAQVSDDELKASFLRETNRAQATVVRFLPSMFTAKVPAPKDAELAEYQKSHAKEIADHYEANKFLYSQPEKVRARHILIKVAEDAPADAKEAAKKQLEDLKKELDGGKDFAELARLHSQDEGSKAQGGDLGLQERGAWVTPFSDAAFALKPGEVSAPVLTKFGWHLIKVEEKTAPTTKELKDVEAEIARTLYQKEKSQELARAEAQKALDAARAGKKLSELYPPDKDTQPNAMRFQVESKPQAIETGEFNASATSLPQLGVMPELIKDVFALEAPQVLEKLYPTSDGFAVVVVTERKQPNLAEFEGQKEQLRKDALQAKRMELRRAYPEALRKQAEVVLNEEVIGAPIEG